MSTDEEVACCAISDPVAKQEAQENDAGSVHSALTSIFEVAEC